MLQKTLFASAFAGLALYGMAASAATVKTYQSELGQVTVSTVAEGLKYP